MTDYLAQLDNFAVITLTGEERVKYLQGQVTADIHLLHNKNALMGCHCDFKGKTWNVFYAVNQQDCIHLISHRGGIQGSLPELKKYAVFAKTDIDENDQLQIFGGSGNKLQTTIQNVFGDVPQQQRQVIANENGLVVCIDTELPRYLVLLNKDAANSLVDQYPSELSSSELWQLQDIQQGIAHIEPATSNEYVPQMLNMQSLDAISFDKGCYMGQEMVARTKFLGKNKRATYILKGEHGQSLAAGDTLEMPIGDNWRRGGIVISCVSLASNTNESWMLAVLANDTEIGAQFRSKADPSALFTVQPLPYSLEK
ncbi:tRNA-modifying protein YgfZ [Alteromonadaceae bacterium BrNp21-10]|nr:tRNA-modifying protein YgfZ [Alteromonadaceae bacterium BrNp21-10]